MWLVAVLLMAAPPAFGEEPTEADRVRARELAGEAFDLVRAGDLDTALAKLLQADEIVEATTLKLEIAEVLNRQGKLKEAAERYRQAIAIEVPATAPPVHHQAREKAIQRLSIVLTETPRLVVEVDGAAAAGAQITVDGQPATAGESLMLNPGAHQIVVRSGGNDAVRVVELARGAVMTERITLAAPSPPPAVAVPPPFPPEPPAPTTSSGWMPLAWALMAVGTGGLATWGIAGAIALTRESELEDSCGGRQCPAEMQSDVDGFETAKLASTIGFAIGVAGVVLAVPPLVIALSEDPGAAEMTLGPGTLRLQGRF